MSLRPKQPYFLNQIHLLLIQCIFQMKFVSYLHVSGRCSLELVRFIGLPRWCFRTLVESLFTFAWRLFIFLWNSSSSFFHILTWDTYYRSKFMVLLYTEMILMILYSLQFNTYVKHIISEHYLNKKHYFMNSINSIYCCLYPL